MSRQSISVQPRTVTNDKVSKNILRGGVSLSASFSTGNTNTGTNQPTPDLSPFQRTPEFTYFVSNSFNNINGHYNTLQGAIDAIPDDAVQWNIVIHEGQYREYVNFNRENLFVKSIGNVKFTAPEYDPLTSPDSLWIVSENNLVVEGKIEIIDDTPSEDTYVGITVESGVLNTRLEIWSIKTIINSIIIEGGGSGVVIKLWSCGTIDMTQGALFLEADNIGIINLQNNVIFQINVNIFKRLIIDNCPSTQNRFTANTCSSNTGECIYSGVSYVKIRNLTYSSISLSISILEIFGGTVVLENCYFRHTGLPAVVMNNVGPMATLVLRNCYIEGNPNFSIESNSPMPSIVEFLNQSTLKNPTNNIVEVIDVNKTLI